MRLSRDFKDRRAYTKALAGRQVGLRQIEIDDDVVAGEGPCLFAPKLLDDATVHDRDRRSTTPTDILRETTAWVRWRVPLTTC